MSRLPFWKSPTKYKNPCYTIFMSGFKRLDKYGLIERLKMESIRERFSNYLDGFYVESVDERVRLYDDESQYIDIIPASVMKDDIIKGLECLDKGPWLIGLDYLDITLLLYQHNELTWYYMQWTDECYNYERIVSDIEQLLTEKKKEILGMFVWSSDGVSIIAFSELVDSLRGAYKTCDYCFQVVENEKGKNPRVCAIISLK